MARIKKCKNPQGEANKSANRWGNLRTKGEVVPLSVYTVPSLARVRIKYIFLHDFAAYFYLQQLFCLKLIFLNL